MNPYRHWLLLVQRIKTIFSLACTFLRRLIRAVMWSVVLFCVSFWFSQSLFSFVISYSLDKNCSLCCGIFANLQNRIQRCKCKLRLFGKENCLDVNRCIYPIIATDFRCLHHSWMSSRWSLRYPDWISCSRVSLKNKKETNCHGWWMEALVWVRPMSLVERREVANK